MIPGRAPLCADKIHHPVQEEQLSRVLVSGCIGAVYALGIEHLEKIWPFRSLWNHHSANPGGRRVPRPPCSSGNADAAATEQENQGTGAWVWALPSFGGAHVGQRPWFPACEMGTRIAVSAPGDRACKAKSGTPLGLAPFGRRDPSRQPRSCSAWNRAPLGGAKPWSHWASTAWAPEPTCEGCAPAWLEPRAHGAQGSLSRRRLASGLPSPPGSLALGCVASQPHR